MTEHDLTFFRYCFSLGLVKPSFLEIGSAKVQGAVPNLCETARALGMRETFGVDLDRGPGVDAVFDFSVPAEQFKQTWTAGKFSSVGVFNVLEHTFDPFVVLQNASYCLNDSGTLLVAVPAVWPLHNYPGDYVRIMPQWYTEFARRTQLTIHPDAFCWLSAFGLASIEKRRPASDAAEIPGWHNSGRAISPARYWRSRLVHKLFNTYGRSHWATHAAIGVAFSRT